MARTTATILVLLCAACGGDGGDDDDDAVFDAGGAIDAVLPDAAPPSPADLAGLVLWLDAEDLADLTDGDPVEMWPDRSPMGNDATYTQSKASPIQWKRFEANGKATVRFDGTEDSWIGTGTNGFGGTDATVFAVARRDAGVAGGGSAIFSQAVAGLRLDFGRYLGQPRFVAKLGLTRGVAQSESETSALAVLVGRKREGSMELYVDGELEAVASGAPSSGLGTVSFALGADFDSAPSGPSYFAGDVSAILIYNRDLAPGEREFVQQYLMDEYSIEPSTDESYLPNQIPGMRLWLNASFVDQLPDTDVTEWLDSSSSLNDGALTSATGPTLIDDPVFGKLLRFNGAEQFQLGADPVAGTAAFSMFAVARRDAGVGTGSAIVGLREAGPSGCMLDYGGSGGANPRFLVRDSVGLSGAAQSPDARTDLIIIEGALSGTTVTVRVNGEPKSAVDGGFSGTFDWDDYAIGAANSGTPMLFGGDIGEVLVFERVLSTAERDALEAYLRAKHNIP